MLGDCVRTFAGEQLKIFTPAGCFRIFQGSALLAALLLDACSGLAYPPNNDTLRTLQYTMTLRQESLLEQFLCTAISCTVQIIQCIL